MNGRSSYDYTTETNELAAVPHFGYDPLGRLARRVDRMGSVRQFEYDNLSRNTAEVWYNSLEDALADEDRVRTFSFAFDAAGRMTEVDDAEADFEFGYDGLDRTVSITETIAGLAPVVAFTQEFDPRGLRTQLAATIGGTADFLNDWTYDNLGRTTRLTQSGQQGGNAVAEKRIDFAWDLAGRPSSFERFASLAGTNQVAATDYVFGELGRLTGLTHSKGQNVLVDYDWTFDGAGNLTRYENSTDGLVDYTHDATGQLGPARPDARFACGAIP